MRDKLIDFLKSNDIMMKNVSVKEQEITCMPCSRAISTQQKNFVRDFINHCKCSVHKDNCGWIVDRDYTDSKCSFGVTECSSGPLDRFLCSPSSSHTVYSLNEQVYLDSEENPPISSNLQNVIELKRVESECQTVETPKIELGTQTIPAGKCDFEENLISFYTSMDFDLKPGVSSDSIRRYYSEFPVAKAFTENGFNRTTEQSKHSTFVKEYTAAAGLKHTMSSSIEWSSSFGGPRDRSVRNYCKPQVRVLPYIDRNNFLQHMDQFKSYLEKHNNISDFSRVPIQASFDGTAVTGRYQTRNNDDNVDDRIIYGVATSIPTQKTFVSVNDPDAERTGKRISKSREAIKIHSMEHTLELLDAGELARAKLYISIVLLPLIRNARPYALGMYAVTKGSDASSLLAAQREVVDACRQSGLKVIVLPGDGDATLRSLQWSNYFCKRYDWLTQLLIPLDLFYDSYGENPIFPLQDPLHNIKKARNNIKRLETRILCIGVDKSRYTLYTLLISYLNKVHNFH